MHGHSSSLSKSHKNYANAKTKCKRHIAKTLLYLLFLFCSFQFQTALTDVIAQSEIKSSFNLQYYDEACDKRQDPSLQLNAWATQLRKNIAAVASR